MLYRNPPFDLEDELNDCVLDEMLHRAPMESMTNETTLQFHRGMWLRQSILQLRNFFFLSVFHFFFFLFLFLLLFLSKVSPRHKPCNSDNTKFKFCKTLLIALNVISLHNCGKFCYFVVKNICESLKFWIYKKLKSFQGNSKLKIDTWKFHINTNNDVEMLAVRYEAWTQCYRPSHIWRSKIMILINKHQLKYKEL